MKKTNKKKLEEFIRVDHAGERGAIKIYEGQLLALNTIVKDENLKKIIEAGAIPILYMTPAYAIFHRRFDAAMTAVLARRYVETGNAIRAMVIPVGLAFAEAYARRPDVRLHKNFDGSHPSLLGTYLAACVVFTSLYDASPIGTNYNYFGKVNEPDAKFLQKVAFDTVKRFYGR